MAMFSGRTAEVTTTGPSAGTFDVINWSFSHEIARVETTNTKTLGAYTSVPGIEKATGSFTIHYDDGVIPTGLPICTPGQQLLNLMMYVATGDDHFAVDEAVVTTMDATADVNGNVDYTVNWESNGTITGWTP